MLWEDISTNYYFSSLMTCHLQQDPLENIFGTLRQMHGCNVTRNALQFTTGLKHIMIKRLFKLPTGDNIEKDSFLWELSKFSLQDKSFGDYVQRLHHNFPSLEEISQLLSNIHSNLPHSAKYRSRFKKKNVTKKSPLDLYTGPLGIN